MQIVTLFGMGQNFENFQNSKIHKNVLEMVYFCKLPPYFASNHEMSLSNSKNFSKTLFFTVEKID